LWPALCSCERLHSSIRKIDCRITVARRRIPKNSPSTCSAADKCGSLPMLPLGGYYQPFGAVRMEVVQKVFFHHLHLSNGTVAQLSLGPLIHAVSAALAVCFMPSLRAKAQGPPSAPSPAAPAHRRADAPACRSPDAPACQRPAEQLQPACLPTTGGSPREAGSNGSPG